MFVFCQVNKQGFQVKKLTLSDLSLMAGIDLLVVAEFRSGLQIKINDIKLTDLKFKCSWP